MADDTHKFFKPAPKPASNLGYHRILSPTAGVRVSPLCLGAMNFGEHMKDIMGECNKETSFAMLDYFWEQGGNFIDTANDYQGGESEMWVGEWMQSRQNRDEMVLATKFTMGYRTGGSEKLRSNLQGNHAKSLKLSVAASCRKLQTNYLDLIYVHWWDFSTSIPELMNSLHALVSSGKVLYLGISDTPAWIVVKCNDYARQHGLTQFSVYQGIWNCVIRDFEREILPMVQAEGMGLAPWGAVGRGMLKKPEDYSDPDREGRKISPTQPGNYARVSQKLDEIAQRKGTIITSVALAYVMHKAPYVFPIVGGRKVEHLQGNIQALSLELSDGELKEIEDAEPFDVGFPLNLIFGTGYRTGMQSSDIAFVNGNARIESVPAVKPIPPGQGERKWAARGM